MEQLPNDKVRSKLTPLEISEFNNNELRGRIKELEFELNIERIKNREIYAVLQNYKTNNRLLITKLTEIEQSKGNNLFYTPDCPF